MSIGLHVMFVVLVKCSLFVYRVWSAAARSLTLSLTLSLEFLNFVYVGHMFNCS